jgi:hypothetical protein
MIDLDSILAILIPDVHGRKFWEDALPFIEQGVPTIFMGDYLDVYSHEKISPDSAVDNFKKILETAKTNKNVQMLVGNHDAGYAIDRYICDCRTDQQNFMEIRCLFMDNFDLFKLCSKVVADEKTFMISHAGIHPHWFASYASVFDKMRQLSGEKIEHIDDFFNNVLLKSFRPDFNPNESEDNMYMYKWALHSLAACGRTRGGRAAAGSIVWADIHEYSPLYVKEQFKYEQIVGHTMQYYTESPFIISGVITCIDCFERFYIDKEGDLRRLKDGVLAENIEPKKNK